MSLAHVLKSCRFMSCLWWALRPSGIPICLLVVDPTVGKITLEASFNLRPDEWKHQRNSALNNENLPPYSKYHAFFQGIMSTLH